MTDERDLIKLYFQRIIGLASDIACSERIPYPMEIVSKRAPL